MDPLSIAVGTGNAIVLCIQSARTLIAVYKSFVDAEQELAEFVLQLEGQWLKINYQLDFMREIWNVLDDDFQIHQIKLLSLLELKLQAANDQIDGLVSEPKQGNAIMHLLHQRGRLRRLRYVALVKESLQNAMNELEKWGGTFDMSWYLILRMSNEALDERMNAGSSEMLDADNAVDSLVNLRRTINDGSSSDAHAASDSSSGLLLADNFPYKQEIPFCMALLTFDARINETLLLDTIVLNSHSDPNTTRRDIRHIATTLQAIEPMTFGLLRCHGVVKTQGANPVYQFAFLLPSTTQNPSSLRGLLVGRESYTLNQRLQVARQMSRAVMLVHATSFVHKNVRPDTIVVVEEKENTEMKWPFLIGFERFRLAEGKTFRQGDESWEKNLYRHPSRQGARPDEDYSMQHDIYSLGVCLLEIGLWHSFLQPLPESDTFQPDPRLEIDVVAHSRDIRKNALNTKKIMVALAKEKLPHTMGKIYADIVTTCLTCLDKSGNTFGDEDDLDDDDGILVALRYIEKIWVELQKICI